MGLDFHGRLREGPAVRAGLLGCGSHTFRNIAPTFRFAPVELVATCDLDGDRAAAFARVFGAEASYDDYRAMLENESLDAVFMVTGTDEEGRVQYPRLAVDCLAAGTHVWMEKPGPTTLMEVEQIRAAAAHAGRNVVVGYKKMFAPANEKARALIGTADFGAAQLVQVEYPEAIPPHQELRGYLDGAQPSQAVLDFLDHFCHPASLLVFLAGRPDRAVYERSASGAGVATFVYASGAVATLAFTSGGAHIDGLERTVIVSDSGRHVVVDNNTRVSYHRLPFPGYGDVPDFYGAPPDEATVVWQPEFSLGQLYNKGLFLLGYWGEIDMFARAVLTEMQPAKATLDDARDVAYLLEAFAVPPGTPTAIVPR